MRHRRTILGTRLGFLSTKPSNRSIGGDDSVAGNERSERVVGERGADCIVPSEHRLIESTIGREGVPERGEPSPRVSQITL